jgi:pyridoxal phosphate enzyme (YggS family)
MASLTYTPARQAELVENLREVQQHIKDAYDSAAGDTRNPSVPRLVAVSKLKPASDILALYDAGHRHFGENYIQELTDKVTQLPRDITWHFIGTLQSNKAKTLVDGVGGEGLVVETLGSVKTAKLLEKAMEKRPEAGRLKVFIQVNTSKEENKSGVDPLPSLTNDASEPTPPTADHELVKLTTYILQSTHLHLQGLMTIGSIQSSTSHTVPNPDFTTLHSTRHALHSFLVSKQGNALLGDGGTSLLPDKEEQWELSMGMSSDYEQAIKQGSASVRVGTKIFGERPRKVDVGGTTK